MKVFVPFKLLRAETCIAMEGIAQFVPLVGDFDYWHYFRQRWAEGKTFINVEQDVVPTRQQLEELLACPNSWCGYGYSFREEPEEEKDTAFLGCTKIGGTLIADHPDAWRNQTHWAVCDMRLRTVVGNRNFCHHGKVHHLESCNPFVDDGPVIPAPRVGVLPPRPNNTNDKQP